MCFIKDIKIVLKRKKTKQNSGLHKVYKRKSIMLEIKGFLFLKILGFIHTPAVKINLIRWLSFYVDHYITLKVQK